MNSPDSLECPVCGGFMAYEGKYCVECAMYKADIDKSRKEMARAKYFSNRGSFRP